MTKKLELYKCEVCGNLVQVVLTGQGELTCCSQPMKLLEPNSENSPIGEKHSPVVEFRDNKKFVQVMSHPMIDEHYIEFLEVYKKDKSELHLKYLKPQDIPEMDISNFSDDLEATAYCNIHGLWRENKND